MLDWRRRAGSEWPSAFLSRGPTDVPIEEGTRPSGDEALEEMSETQGTAPWTGFEQELSRFHERSLRQEEIIRLMQARITELQGDQVQALLRPMLRRIAGLHAQAAEARDGAAARGEKAVNDFSYYMVAIEEALGMVDLDSVEARAGDAFAPETQHAASALPTGDPSLHRTIQRVLSQGFKYPDSDRAAIPAQVAIYRYDEELGDAAAGTGAPQDDSQGPDATEASAPQDEDNIEGN